MIIDLIVAITGVILYAMHAKEAELGLRIIKVLEYLSCVVRLQIS